MKSKIVDKNYFVSEDNYAAWYDVALVTGAEMSAWVLPKFH